MRSNPSGQGTFVIVGAGPAAHAAASAYRSSGGSGRVLLITDDVALPYQRPPLSKDYLRGDLAERDAAAELALVGAAELDEAGIEVLLGRRVTGLDPAARTVTTADGETFTWTTCLLATGARPMPLPVEGGDHPHVHLLRSIADAHRLRQSAERIAPDGRVVVIGSGFIGCEAAASLARRGLRVTLITDEDAPQLARLGGFAAARIGSWLESEGVETIFAATVRGIRSTGTGERTTSAVLLEDAEVEAELLVSATGVRPCSELAEHAGLATEEDRILVDEHLHTSAAGILAAGDVALAHNPSAGRRLKVEHWGEALAMGEVAGTVAAGGDARWDGVPGFWSQIGDRTLKYAAWGDGFDDARVQEHAGGGFTVRYGRDGVLVGVLTHDADDDYDAAAADIAARSPGP